MEQSIVLHEEFNSLESYLHVIGKRPKNDVMINENSSDSGSLSFTGTHDYQESVDIIRKGYKSALSGLLSVDRTFSHRENAPKDIPQLGVVGYAPHVPNCVMGAPYSMISKAPVEQKNKIITILYYFGDYAGRDADHFIDAGKKVLNIINTLEIKGYRVGLYVMGFVGGDTQLCFNSVKIKDYRQPRNPLKMAYPLCHPSFFRRQKFRWCETYPLLTDYSVQSGYGKPLHVRLTDKDKRDALMREHGILKDNYFFIEFIEAYEKTPEQLIDSMGIGSVHPPTPKSQLKYEPDADDDDDNSDLPF